MSLKGPFVSAGIALLSVIGLAFVFVKNASPYATVAEAAKLSSSGVHVIASIVPGSMKQNLVGRTLDFTIKDETGSMPVRYDGPPMANLETAPQVVAIGNVEGGVLKSYKILVKCPSKYDAEKKGG